MNRYQNTKNKEINTLMMSSLTKFKSLIQIKRLEFHQIHRGYAVDGCTIVVTAVRSSVREHGR